MTARPEKEYSGSGHLPYGESGLGNYGSNLGQLNGKYTILLNNSYVFDLVKEIPFPDKTSVYNIGDYGTADGAAAMTFIRSLLVWLKDVHGESVQFQVIHEDREVNDFNSLFRRLSGLIPDPPSYLADLHDVFALASGTDFYKQCVPSESMHIIVCMAAIHWLSGKPPVYKDSIYCLPGTDAIAESTVQRQSADDWERFLLLRSKELKVGGLLIVSAPSDNPHQTGEGHKLCNENFLHLTNSAWKMFRDTGRITEVEFVNTNVACYHKSLAMLKAPFENPQSPVSKCGLRLLSSEVVTLPCEFYTAWRRAQNAGEGEERRTARQEYTRRFVSAHRCWSNSAFIAGLSDSRSQKEKEAIVDEMYAMVEKKVEEMGPEVFKDDYRFAYIFARKCSRMSIDSPISSLGSVQG